MKLTKNVLRKLILEALYENEEKFSDQASLEAPHIASMSDAANLLNDYILRHRDSLKEVQTLRDVLNILKDAIVAEEASSMHGEKTQY